MEKTKRRNKPAVNVVDLLIVLLILAVGAVLLYVFVFNGRGEQIAPQMRTVRYVVELKNVRDEFTDKVTVGENAFDSVGLYNIGIITAYEEKDATRRGTNLVAGEPVITPYPGRKNLYLTIEAQANLENNIYSIGGYRITVGMGVSLKMQNFSGTGNCITFEVID